MGGGGVGRRMSAREGTRMCACLFAVADLRSCVWRWKKAVLLESDPCVWRALWGVRRLVDGNNANTFWPVLCGECALLACLVLRRQLVVSALVRPAIDPLPCPLAMPLPVELFHFPV